MTPIAAADTGPTELSDLARVFRLHGRELLRYCTRRVGEQAAEDVVAETFLTAYERRHRFDPARGDLLPWLYGIATRLLRRHRRTELAALRAVGRSSAAPTEPVDERAVARADAHRVAARVADAVTSLPRRQREVLLLYAVAELEYAQIAEALGIPLGSVRSALHRARAKVRAALADPGGLP